MKMPNDFKGAQSSLDSGLAWLAKSQDKDGSWDGDYGGPLFLLPLYIATTTIIEEPLDAPTRAEMERYIRAHQNSDGGFGLHIEGKSCLYGTSANYVALRLLGVPASDAQVAKAREYLHARGGPIGSASWGKFFLALLDLYPYEALNPTPPELWLLPESAVVHPSRLWCHCRMVYLPMSYLYRNRARWTHHANIQELREELYPLPFHEIDWSAARTTVYPDDNLSPPSALAKLTNRALLAAERAYPKRLSKRALEFVLHQIDREDKNTNYICIGPINKLLNTLCWYFEDRHGPELKAHRERLSDYLYQGPDGIRMQGYNSSRLWDTTFAAQALLSAGAGRQLQTTLLRAHDYIEKNQVRSDVFDHASAYRHPSKGGWPFSDRPHGWPISDCTAEGIKSSIALQPFVNQPIAQERLEDAVQLVLSLQNADGGWATYELTRGPKWLELLNPSDCFRDIMIDYSYVECTSACVQALVRFSDRYPSFLPSEIAAAVERGKNFLLSAQRADGSFEGAWGVCFTYGAWFGIHGLRAAGLPCDHPAIERAAAYLLSKQNRDGGWGETVENCNTLSYASGVESQVVMTSWALLALLESSFQNQRAVERGIEFLCRRRRADGTYPNEKSAGVFNKTCAITYDNYLKIFPVWATAEYLKRHGALKDVTATAAE